MKMLVVRTVFDIVTNCSSKYNNKIMITYTLVYTKFKIIVMLLSSICQGVCLHISICMKNNFGVLCNSLEKLNLLGDNNKLYS